MFDYGDDWLGCGTEGHDVDCLCDVVLRNPLRPLDECMTDAVQDMWMARTMCEVRGYSRPWTNEKILDFLVDMRTFYDAYHESSQPLAGAEQLCNVEAFVPTSNLTPIQLWHEIRAMVSACMDRFPDEPFVAVIQQLGLKPQDVVDAMTTRKSGPAPWDYVRVQRLDDLFCEHQVSFAAIGREFGLSEDAIRGLFKYWGRKRIHKWGDIRPEPPAVSMFRQLCLETDLSPMEVVRRVEEAHGVVYSRSNVTNTRRRHRDRNGTMVDRIEP